MTNPLQKYYRQPKIYLSLPSKGKFYPEGTIAGDPTNLPVFGMTAMDEIMMKTPDALFSGESVIQVIKSCIPDIVDPWQIPQIDIDSILIAIRIATYGQTLPLTFSCNNCKEENNIDLDLSKTLEYFVAQEYQNYIFIDPLTVFIKPLTYKDQTQNNLKQYELRRMLMQVNNDLSEEEKAKMINDIYNQINELQVITFKKSIESVQADDAQVEDPQQIQEWIQNSDKLFFDKIKTHMESLASVWKIQSQTTKCASCQTENKVDVNLDNSDFFVNRLS